MNTQWPKVPPPLNEAQLVARERFMALWHEILPVRFGWIEAFNQGYPASLPLRAGSKTLEVGAGIGAHAEFENLELQEYHVMDVREEFCDRLSKRLPGQFVHCGDIQQRTGFPDATFDRIVAIHVLEHLCDLPKAVAEIGRILKPDGVFDVVLPCEGGFVYSLARAVSAKRVFERTFHMAYEPIIRNEHVSTLPEIKSVLLESFAAVQGRRFPFPMLPETLNLCVGYRFVKRPSAVVATAELPVAEKDLAFNAASLR